VLADLALDPDSLRVDGDVERAFGCSEGCGGDDERPQARGAAQADDGQQIGGYGDPGDGPATKVGNGLAGQRHGQDGADNKSQ